MWKPAFWGLTWQCQWLMGSSTLELGKVFGCASTETGLAPEKFWWQSMGYSETRKEHHCPPTHLLPPRAASTGPPFPTRQPVIHSLVDTTMGEGQIPAQRKIKASSDTWMTKEWLGLITRITQSKLRISYCEKVKIFAKLCFNNKFPSVQACT